MQQYETSQDYENMNLSRQITEGNEDIRSYHFSTKLNVIAIRAFECNAY